MFLTEKDFPIDVNCQSIEIPGSGGVRQSTLTPNGVLDDYLFEDAKTIVEALHRGLKVSNNGPCLGWRASKPEYKWLSYEEVIKRSRDIASGLIHCGMKRGQETFVVIYAQNCVEWVLVEHACYCHSVVTVPLYETAQSSDTIFILNQVEAEIVICDTENKVRKLLDVYKDIPQMKRIIAIQEVSVEMKDMAMAKDIILNNLKDIEILGKKNPENLMLPSPSDLATICYTSGTTGIPKGAMITHANMIADAGSILKQLGNNYLTNRDSHLSYLPLAHMLERVSHVIYISIGASIGFYRGDINLLAEDIRTFKPTMLPAVPRVLNKIYDKIQNEVKSNSLRRLLLNAALRAKEVELSRGIIRDNSFWDHFVLRKIRNALGGKVRILVTGGAPIRDEVLMFFRCSLGCPVIQGYGQTEIAAAATMSVIGDCSAGTVGPPVTCCFVKLTDVPEMGYYAQNGEGEILVKGSNVMKGYFKDPERTAEVLDEEGWLHTGDIGWWTERGTLSIIDRKKNIFKLSQGEYVVPEKVETVYLACPYVEQIFVDGDSMENFLVAIVVPNKDILMSWCSAKGITGEWESICQNNDVKTFILKQMTEHGKEAGLKGFERVKAIHLYPDGFSVENGILTATLKVKRSQCRQKFKNIIRKLYESQR